MLIRGACVLTMDPQRRILADADVRVRGARIAEVGASGRRLRADPGEEVVAAAGLVLMPGFVQAHVHLCQTLFRNRAEGLGLLDWLRLRIWPLEAAHDAHSVRVAALLGMAELIRGGTTAALDMGTVRHTDSVFDAARSCGFRLTGGKAHMDGAAELAPGLRETTAASLVEAEALCRRWHGAEDGRLRYAFAPRFVLSCSAELLESVAALARERGARLHTHASEDRSECALVRRRFGCGNVAALHRMGLCGADAAFAHCVWLEPGEEEILRDTGTHVVHCPSANLKLGSGVARIPEMLAGGIRVALGADGAACNNNLDAWTEMRLAALVHKPRAGPASMPPEVVLEMGTLGGARALGLESEIGSIEEGKRADLVLVDLNAVPTAPAGFDLPSALVHSAGRDRVRQVWIDGRCVLRDDSLLAVDEKALLAAAAEEAARLATRL